MYDWVGGHHLLPYHTWQQSPHCCVYSKHGRNFLRITVQSNATLILYRLEERNRQLQGFGARILQLIMCQNAYVLQRSLSVLILSNPSDKRGLGLVDCRARLMSK